MAEFIGDSIAARLQAIAKYRRLSASQMAALCGVEESVLEACLYANQEPTLRMVANLAKTADLRLDWIVFGGFAKIGGVEISSMPPPVWAGPTNNGR